VVSSEARAQTPVRRIQLGILLLSNGESGTEMVRAGLDEALVPYTLVDLNAGTRPTIDAAFLSDTIAGDVKRAKFQAVVLPNDAPAQLIAAELAALDTFERDFKIRQLDAYVYPGTWLGTNAPGYSGPLDGFAAAATSGAATAGFGHLKGPVPFEDLDVGVQESYGYLAAPLPPDTANERSFSVMVDAPIPNSSDRGVVVGVYSDHGREQMIVTAAMNQYQQQQQLLFPGILDWLTYGVHMGTERNYFAVHVDDIFLGDQRWVVSANCTSEDDCPPEITAPDVLMTTEDVNYLLAWQTAHGFKLDMVFNGFGYDDAMAENGSFPLGSALLAHKADLRWINHTYSHAYLGCVQDLSVKPWVCLGGPSTPTWVSQPTVADELSKNIMFASMQGLAIDPQEMVSGEHSGLRRTPQEPSDNPNFVAALADLHMQWLGSDNSREPTQRTFATGHTVPRYPMNIFYNVGLRSEEVDEYNWIYTSAANGGSGICETDTTSSCITPLDPNTSFETHIVPLEARFALAHIHGNSPKPHYAHQSNLAEERVLYPVVDATLSKYHELWSDTAPLINPTLKQSGEELIRHSQWQTQQSQVSGYIQGPRLVLHSSVSVLDSSTVPLTVPSEVASAGLDTYATRRTGWVDVRGFLGSSYVLPGSVGYAQ
jgi:hypothetical protein